MVVRLEPLRPSHLVGFAPDEPMPTSFPAEQLGHAVAVVDERGTLAIFGAVLGPAGATVLGLYLDPCFRLTPLTLHRTARLVLARLRAAGHDDIRARARDARGHRWLRRLGIARLEEERA